MHGGLMRLLILAIALSLSLESHNYYSQYRQDKLIHETYFQGVKNGVFVDIGAYDGIILSNTLFFEKELGWTGLCIEPIPEVFAQLKENRTCKCIQGCISNLCKNELLFRAASSSVCTEMLSGLAKTYDPVRYQILTHEVNKTGGNLQILHVYCFLVNDLLKNNNIPHVNFLSINTAGGEYEIIESIDYDRFTIDVISVDDSYDDPRFIPFLERKGFKLERKSGPDLLFVNTNFNPKKVK